MGIDTLAKHVTKKKKTDESFNLIKRFSLKTSCLLLVSGEILEEVMKKVS